jgi:hypothetical protein
VTIEQIGPDGGKVKLIIVNNVQVDPGAEYQVLASVTEASCTNVTCTGAADFIKMGTKFPGTFPLSLNPVGLDFKVLTDIRIPGAITTKGFKTNLTGAGTAILGLTALADGYYAPVPTTAASKFYYWNLDIDLAPLLNPNVREVSITLAKARWLNKSGQCRYDVRGFVHDPIGTTGLSVALYRADATGAKIPTAPVISTVAVTSLGDIFGKWDVSTTTSVNPALINVTTGCPVNVRAEITATPTVFTAEPLTLRIDPLFDQFAP